MTDPVAAGPGPRAVRVWDPLVRVFHWSLAGLFLLNFAVLEDESAAHEWVGYAIAGLIGLRLLWGLIGTRHARFSAFPPDPKAAWAHARDLLRGRPDAHPALSHNPLGALMVYALLAILLALAATGWMQTLDAFWGVEWVEEVHETLANLAAILIGLHVAGVLVEAWRSRVPLIKAMITGWKTLPGRTRS